MKEINVSDTPESGNLRGFIEELKKAILEETKQAYGEKAFHRWMNLLYEGAFPAPDGYACRRSGCGDSMEMFLNFCGGRVSQASFRSAGCGASAVCGSYAAERALHKSAEEILEITGKTILDSLGGLPREEAPMAAFAVETLHAALRDYMRRHERKKGHTLK